MYIRKYYLTWEICAKHENRTCSHGLNAIHTRTVDVHVNWFLITFRLKKQELCDYYAGNAVCNLKDVENMNHIYHRRSMYRRLLTR